MSAIRSFYKRPLPSDLIAFSSVEGKELFREALADNTMRGFFPLIEQFNTQNEPAYCGLTSLAIVLNALGVDPNRLWRAPWRWFAEELLDCCIALRTIQETGISLDELACLALCNGVDCEMKRVDESVTIDTFRRDIERAMIESTRNDFLIVSFNRTDLAQSGSGHFSPVGGFHRAKDLILILDTARFKYPPFWVSVSNMFEAARSIDKMTGKARGYVIISSSNQVEPDVLSALYAAETWTTISEHLQRVRQTLTAADADELIAHYITLMQPIMPVVSQIKLHDSDDARWTELCTRVSCTPAYAAIAQRIGHEQSHMLKSVLTVLFLNVERTIALEVNGNGEQSVPLVSSMNVKTNPQKLPNCQCLVQRESKGELCYSKGHCGSKTNGSTKCTP